MTAGDGYFTDPLLQRWYLGCLHDSHRAHVRRHLSPQTDVGAVLCWSHPNMPVGQHMDLRAMIRAELLAAQEMREVLRKIPDELGYCPCCYMRFNVIHVAVDGTESKEEHDADCRFSALTGDQP